MFFKLFTASYYTASPVYDRKYNNRVLALDLIPENSDKMIDICFLVRRVEKTA